MSFIYTNIEKNTEHKYTTLQCKSCGELLIVPVYCGNRFCVICNKSRMLRVRFRLAALVDKIELKKSEKFVHLILTVKSMSDPKEMCRYLQKCFRKFRNRKIFKTHFSGGAYVIELTYANAGWHAHIHCILQGTYCPQAELLKAWRSIAGAAGLFIKNMPKDAIIHYLTKYMCKTDLEDEKRVEAAQTLKGLRLFIVIGSWHDLLPGWSKVPYACPKCDCTSWLPVLFMDEETGRRFMNFDIGKYDSS